MSSRVAAGIDMMYVLLKHLYGEQQININMNNIELAPHADLHWDPFSAVHNVSFSYSGFFFFFSIYWRAEVKLIGMRQVPGHDTESDMRDCFGPVEMPLASASGHGNS